MDISRRDDEKGLIKKATRLAGRKPTIRNYDVDDKDDFNKPTPESFDPNTHVAQITASTTEGIVTAGVLQEGEDMHGAHIVKGGNSDEREYYGPNGLRHAMIDRLKSARETLKEAMIFAIRHAITHRMIGAQAKTCDGIEVMNIPLQRLRIGVDTPIKNTSQFHPLQKENIALRKEFIGNLLSESDTDAKEIWRSLSGINEEIINHVTPVLSLQSDHLVMTLSYRNPDGIYL